ncbi:hypothetical protein SADUNF_Sadunf12G0045300 [Salix dunnii]|uniref:RING-type domain-containing protein n=1 Tax=Salix dunnii TaxID=1413687 RepID=A0A835JIH0_9ROSI|nr:hypothetical protein SADUNF_Sadunf12G0045300 [Salix dunnii]
MMSWRRVLKSVQALAAHCLLFSFTLFLVLKLDHVTSYSWWRLYGQSFNDCVWSPTLMTLVFYSYRNWGHCGLAIDGDDGGKLSVVVPYVIGGDDRVGMRFIFFPLWTFHGVVARGRFALPAPSAPRNRHWAPCHAVVATPLLIAFELLLCIYLESVYVYHIAAVNLKIVFIPLVAFEIIILIDNFRMCKALMPGEEESITDEAIWETLPVVYKSVQGLMNFLAIFVALLGCNFYGFLCGWYNLYPPKAVRYPFPSYGGGQLLGSRICDVGALGWWDLFVNFSIAECFAFLVCTKWSNPVIHRNSQTREDSSSSTTIRYLDWNGGLMVSSEENQHQDRMCGLQDIGGHIMKIPLIGFQVLLCMHLEGTPAGARNIPLLVLFSPLFLLQGAGVLFAASKLAEKLILLLRSDAGTGRYFRYTSRAHDCLGFLHHGSRLLGWWSIDEGSLEEQARLYHGVDAGLVYHYFSIHLIMAHKFQKYFVSFLSMCHVGWYSLVRDGNFIRGVVISYIITSSYNTFCGYPPEIVKKMPKKDLTEEVWRLQAALGEQTEITKYSQHEFERLQNEKVLCRVCFEGEISVVLLPCRHRILCSTCCEKCKKCPVCRVSVEECLPVYDV